MKAKPVLPVTASDDDAARFRDAVNRQVADLQRTIDSALGLRSANPEAQRARAFARINLEQCALWAMQAYNLNARK